MRILVVDDDPEIRSLIRRSLAYEGYYTDTAGDGCEALARAADKPPDLIILDIMMPGRDGIEVCRKLRQDNDDVPILMLTAKGTVADKVSGLECGADDYLVKPFALDELLARVKALLRRRQPREGETLHFSDLSLNTATREIRRSQKSIKLTVQEFDLLELLMRHPHQILRREQIYQLVWGYDYSGESNVLEVYLSYLRSKLEAGGQPRIIHNVRGLGYVLRE